MSSETIDDGARYDVIVIGAGINGAGIARDAAMRGLSVLLLDKGDIASGTTSWSTRLIHGGLRYLEHGEIGLVRESLLERERLPRIAPHLVRPLPLLIPIYRGDRRGRLLIRAGMTAYDLLSFGKSLPRHRMLDREGVARRAPGLARDRLLGGALYYDGQVAYPERLTLENALDAQARGARILTYHEVDRLTTHDGQVQGVAGHDVLTGLAFEASAPVIINVAGPWVDDVLRGAANPIPKRLIGGTKGSHIVVGPFPGAPGDALYAEARRDGRPFFIIPWNDAYLIGTTDTHFDGNLDTVSADQWEIDFLLEETNRLVPMARLARGDVRYSYAGVRPLPYAPDSDESGVTRRHSVVDHAETGGPRGLYSVVGGKLTTYRALAEEAVDIVMRRSGQAFIASRTGDVPLPGGSFAESWQAFSDAFGRDSGLREKSADHLARVYGSRAPELLATALTPALRSVVDPATGAIAAEIPWAFTQEAARTLGDALARRTMIGLGPDAGVGGDIAAARVAMETLGWDQKRADEEVAAYRTWVARYRPLALEPVSSSSGTRA